MGIGADQRVGISDASIVDFVHEDHPRQVFEIDLVHDTRIGRDDGEIAKGGLAPAQEEVALLVALEFQFGVQSECLR